MTANRVTPREPGLPKGESQARDEICDALAELIRGVAEIAEGSGESPILDIRREWHEGNDDGSLTVRGLLRFMTTSDPDGRDGPYGELVQRTWTRVGRALMLKKIAADIRAVLDAPLPVEAGEATTKETHKHRCMRCKEEFDCYSPGVCEAKYNVLPRIVAKRDDGRVEVFDHCPASAPPVSGGTLEGLLDELHAAEVGAWGHFHVSEWVPEPIRRVAAARRAVEEHVAATIAAERKGWQKVWATERQNVAALRSQVKALREALKPFASMHRDGSDPKELACVRGVASDMTVITSGDFERADAALRSTDSNKEN